MTSDQRLHVVCNHLERAITHLNERDPEGAMVEVAIARDVADGSCNEVAYCSACDQPFPVEVPPDPAATEAWRCEDCIEMVSP